MVKEKPPSLEEVENQTKATSIAKHKNEISIVEKLFNHYLVGFEKIEKFTIKEDNELEFAWLLLVTRSFNSLRCAFIQLQNGYYSQAVILVRSVFEDWLTGKDCKNSQSTLNALLHGDDEFWKGEGRYANMAKRVSKEFPQEWRVIYGTLSTIAHVRKRAISVMVDPDTKDLRLGSSYDKDLFLATYQIFLTAASIIPEFIYNLLGDSAEQWWMETLPTLQEIKNMIENIPKELGQT